MVSFVLVHVKILIDVNVDESVVQTVDWTFTCCVKSVNFC